MLDHKVFGLGMVVAILASELFEEGGDMAEAEEEKDNPKDKSGSGSPAKKRSWLPVVLIAVALLIVCGAGGAFVFLKKGSSKESNAPTPTEAKDNHKGKGAEAGAANASGTIFDLDPFVVNLADTTDLRYLKVTIKLELDQATSKPAVEGHIPQIRDNLLVLLSSKDFASVRTVEGKMDLRAEIIQRLNTVLQGDIVKNAYFTEFVSQ